MRNQSLAQEQLSNVDGIKSDIKRQADQDQKRMYSEFEKLVQKTSNGIEQTINTTLVPQLRHLNQIVKNLQEQMEDMQLAKMSLVAKVDKSHEILEDHLDLVNTLNGKVDTSA